MSVLKAIYHLVKAANTSLGEQVYTHGVAPQNIEPPYCSIFKTDSQEWRSINGPSGIEQAFIQIDVYAINPALATEISYAIKQYIDGYRGTVAIDLDNSPSNSVVIGGISRQSNFNAVEQNETPRLYRDTSIYLVTYDF